MGLQNNNAEYKLFILQSNICYNNNNSNKHLFLQVRDDYLRIIDNVLEAEERELLESQKKSNSSSKLVISF